MTKSTSRQKPAPRGPEALSERTARRLLSSLLRRAEGGDVEAAGLVLRLHRETRLQRQMRWKEGIAAFHRATDALTAKREAAAGGTAKLDAELNALLGKLAPDTTSDGEPT